MATTGSAPSQSQSQSQSRTSTASLSSKKTTTSASALTSKKTASIAGSTLRDFTATYGAASAGYDDSVPLCTHTARFPAIKTNHAASLPLWRRYMTISCEELQARVEARESAEACFELGRRYEMGRGGVAKDYAKAAEHFADAADMGHDEARAKLNSLKDWTPAAWTKAREIPRHPNGWDVHTMKTRGNASDLVDDWA
ncbi:hypothetical protein NFJ02_28g65300 [Pycnococcus provasolii]